MNMLSLVSVTCISAAAMLAGCATTTQPRADADRGASTTPDVSVASWDAHTTVGQVVADRPETASIFELVGIDYCCGGNVSLADAARSSNVSVHRLLQALAAVGSPSHDAQQDQQDWRTAPLEELISHIVDTYHAQLRRDLPRLQERIATVHRVHGASHPELAQVQQTFLALRAELEAHLDLEERQAFPAILQVDRGERADVETLLAVLLHDHHEAGQALQQIRQLTDDYAVPADACAQYRAMLAELSSLERDTLAHIHLENNILFPRTRRMLSDATR